MDNEILQLNKLSRELFISNVDRAIEKAELAVDLSRKKRLKEELAESLISLSYVLSVQGSYVSILKYIFEAISISKYLNNMELLSRSYSQLGTNYLINGDLDRAFSSFMKSIEIISNLNIEGDNHCSYLGLGTILSYKESYEDSIDYYNKALDLSRKIGDVLVELKAINNLGYIYNLLEDLDKAEAYLDECIIKCKKEGFINIMIPALDELGIIYKKRGDVNNAVETWERAAKIDKDRGQTYVGNAPLLNLANFYVETELWDEARDCLDRANDICTEINSNIDLLEIYKVETNFYEKKGNYEKALLFHKKYFDVNKIIRSMESVRTLKEVELETLTKSKERIIALSKVGRAITESLNMDKMLMRMNDQIGALFEFSVLGLARYDEKKESISYEMFIEDGVMLPNFTTLSNNKKSLAAWCIRNNQSLVISNLKKQSSEYIEGLNFEPKVKTNGKIPMSVIYNPLKIEEKIIGLITIQSYKTDAYSAEDVDVFDILSSYVAIGLNNALQANKIEEQNRALSILATYDDLTGLKNRRSFFVALKHGWAWSIRTKKPFSIIMLDLDFFKYVNDNFGHPAGDYCLIEIGNILRNLIKRDYDEVARIGGEEFAIFLGESDECGVFEIAEKIRSSIDKHVFIFKGQELPLTASLGITTVRPWVLNDKSIDDIVIEADNALYEAKTSGRNCIKKYQN